MKTISAFLFSLFIAISLSFGVSPDAEAKRFGGARSFGSKPSYSSPYRRSAGNQQRSASEQQAYQKNQSARQAMSRRGGLMGLLGGLALGGLLGSMFFGGAFEGLNFMDILVFGGIAYLLYKLFAAKSSPARASSGYQRQQYEQNDYQSSTYSEQAKQTSSAGFDTDVLFNKFQSAKQQANAHTDHVQATQDAEFDEVISFPDHFEAEAFLKGAKSAFKQLQKAWDDKDLAEIRALTNDKVFAEIQQQIKSDPSINQTDVLRVDAELLDYREIDGYQEVVVLFDCILREDVNQQAEQVKEIWHFTKAKNSTQKTWFLDGIQQLDS